MSTYESVMRERSCTSLGRDHGFGHQPIEAEIVTNGTISYIVLRCPGCNRPQGMRLLRKKGK